MVAGSSAMENSGEERLETLQNDTSSQHRDITATCAVSIAYIADAERYEDLGVLVRSLRAGDEALLAPRWNTRS